VSASATLTFDTEAPDIFWGELPTPSPGHSVSLPYSLSEPGITGAHVVGSSSATINILPNQIDLTLPADYDQNLPVQLTVDVIDNVLNAASILLILQTGRVLYSKARSLTLTAEPFSLGPDSEPQALTFTSRPSSP
jgi:hypothetical protein